jgi:hypothetical protein
MENYKEKLKAIMLDIAADAQKFYEMTPEEIAQYAADTYEDFDIDYALSNPYAVKCGILSAKIDLLESYIKNM